MKYHFYVLYIFYFRFELLYSRVVNMLAINFKFFFHQDARYF